MGQSSSTLDTTKDKTKLKLTLLLMDTIDDGNLTCDTSTGGCGASSVSCWAKSQTEKGNIRCLELERYSLKVVVGPCLKDVELYNLNSMQRVLKTINKAIVTCCEGFDAIILVFRFETSTCITHKDVSVLENLKVILGQNYLKHVIVRTIWPPFTGNQCRFDIWCRKQEGPFQKLFFACNNRCVLVNTFLGDEERQIADINHLAKLAYALRSLHGCYTVNHYQLFAPDRDKWIIRLKHPVLKAKIEQEAEILIKRLEKLHTMKQAYEAGCRRYQELSREVHGHGLLGRVTKIIQKAAKAEEDPHIRNVMQILRSKLEEHERVCQTNSNELFNAIRKLRLEITSEDMNYGQLKDVINIISCLEKYYYTGNKPRDLLEIEIQTEAFRDRDKINIALSVIGNTISAAVPCLSLPTTVLTTAVDLYGIINDMK